MSSQVAQPTTETCLDLGWWTPLEHIKLPDNLDKFTLKFKEVDPDEDAWIKKSKVMTFHLTGCSGNLTDHTPQLAVARAMSAQVLKPGNLGMKNSPATGSSFLYHLGDVVYKKAKTSQGDEVGDSDRSVTDAILVANAKPDFAMMYTDQFYRPYQNYGYFKDNSGKLPKHAPIYGSHSNNSSGFAPIFGIAGNHDGKTHHSNGPIVGDTSQSQNVSKLKGKDNGKTKNNALSHFLLNFCADKENITADNQINDRPAMTQPYIYWRLETPLAYFIGLYSNVTNGGILDDPADPTKSPQYDWLVDQLKDVKHKNTINSPAKAVFLTVHYPPYSGASNFKQRGDPTLSPTTKAKHVQPLANLLQQSFDASGQWPDAVFSAHAHLYERLTYQYTDGQGKVVREIPYIINGSGGDSIEKLDKPCQNPPGTSHPFKTLPASVKPVLPDGINVPASDEINLEAYNDESYGFLRMTVTHGKLTGEFFTVNPNNNTSSLADSFVLDISTHLLEKEVK